MVMLQLPVELPQGHTSRRAGWELSEFYSQRQQSARIWASGDLANIFDVEEFVHALSIERIAESVFP